jgi:hypothetical protein
MSEEPTAGRRILREFDRLHGTLPEGCLLTDDQFMSDLKTVGFPRKAIQTEPAVPDFG